MKNVNGLDANLKSTTYKGQLIKNASLADFTTWRVGGLARQLYKPNGLLDLCLFLRGLPVDEPILFLGLGSNSLIRDQGFAGTVILTQNNLKDLKIVGENLIYVEAGVSCATMARFSARNNLGGGEFWAGIPGTMGGALRMNAGCYGKETWNLVKEIFTINRLGIIKTYRPDQFKVSYRHVEMVPNEWFVGATCLLQRGNKNKSLKLIKELLAKRASTQPIGEYNCGSVFKNPPGHFAAQLIEGCGLKGFQLGGASVSAKHANFIINNATNTKACDIESLINLVKEIVFKKTNIHLVPEVHILGE